LPLLQKLGESRDVARYKRQLEQQQKTANLINALSKGRIQYQPTAEYQPSAFTRLTGAASTGLGAYNAFQNLQAAQAAEKLAQQTGEAELGQLQRKASLQRGAADYAGDIAQQAAGIRATGPGGAGPQLGQFPTFGGQIERDREAAPGGAVAGPSLLEQMGKLDPFRVMGRQQVAREASTQAAADRAAEFDRETRRITAQAAQTRAQAAGIAAGAAPKITSATRTYWNNVGTNIGSLAPTVLSLDDFKNHPAVAGVPDVGMLGPMYESYKIGARDRTAAVGKLGNERIEEMVSAIRSQQAVKDRFDIRRSLTEVVDGILIGGGFSDIGVLKALAKLQDPGSVVRQEEFTTLKQGIALFDRAGIKVDQFFTGNQLNASGRKQVLELAYASYNERTADIDTVADSLVADYSARPGVPESLTTEDWTNASLAYRLPDPDDFISPEKRTGLEARIGGTFRTDLTNIHQFVTPIDDAETKREDEERQRRFNLEVRGVSTPSPSRYPGTY
tara:strand:+ start:496 stop:2007 length:1512 start_codon:yes stop_codon:yes gene_type:complete